MPKEKRIVATGHAIVSEGIAVPSRTLAPGEYIVVDEDNETHQSIIQEIESGREANLEIQDVDVKDDDTTASAPDPIHTDDVLQAPARALEQEVREAQVAQGDDAGQPEEAKEGAEEVQESVEAEQQRQAEEPGTDAGDPKESSSESGSSGSSSRRGGRRSGGSKS
jgi:type IV secretory pathway VirB10-like protein